MSSLCVSGLCLVEGESQFNSSAVGNLNADGSKDLGIFQVFKLFYSLRFMVYWRKSVIVCGLFESIT